MRDILNQPILFIIVLAAMIFAIGHLGHATSAHFGWKVGERFFSLPA